jgi:hypothetical protein
MKMGTVVLSTVLSYCYILNNMIKLLFRDKDETEVT